ncbi:DUF1905 domain-containing protein [Motilibacter aurantiacus]|uniref:DUF1905 domain-containing protein n=1 Tax=Motilibacter aurantiacus TaxID=2714955 RepID=UPI00140A95A0|nr:DUF1905 domain-containing protein [Motilibacter aurantiacus]
MSEDLVVTGEVELFPGPGGWHFVRAPREWSGDLAHRARRGLIAVTATVGSTTWPTSLMPTGDGSHFVALPKAVRAAEDVRLGDDVTVRVRLRDR